MRHRPGTPPPPPLSFRRIEADVDTHIGPVVLAVPVNPTAILAEVSPTDPRAIFTRTVGFWTRRRDVPVAALMARAFHLREKVFVMSRSAGRVLRVYEVRPVRDLSALSLPAGFFHEGLQRRGQFHRESTSDLTVPGPNGGTFAAAYRNGEGLRFRYLGHETADEGLRGEAFTNDRPLNAFPALCTFTDREDPRLAPLLAR